MNWALPLLALALVGCGPTYHITEEARPYAERWESIYGTEVRVDVIMADLGPYSVADCESGQASLVRLDIENWKTSTDFEKEEIVFHEFGHCLMGLGHDSTMIVRNGMTIPRSIMHPNMIGEARYAPNVEYYREELKTSKANEQ